MFKSNNGNYNTKKRSDHKKFTATAKKTKKINTGKMTFRGGIRL